MRLRVWFVVSLMLCLTLAGCSAEKESAAVAEEPAPELFDQATVSVSGKVVPAQRAELGFGIAGVVDSVAVAEGDVVMAGQELARLQAPELAAAVAQAEAALQAAQAQLALLQAGASSQDQAVAEAAVATANGSVAAAQAAVVVAQTNVSAAQAALQGSNANLTLLQAGARPEEVQVAQQQVEQAKSQLYALQAQRDVAGGNKDRSSLAASTYEAAEGAVYAAQDAVEIAELQAKVVAQGARAEELAVAQAQVAQTQAALGVAREPRRPLTGPTHNGDDSAAGLFDVEVRKAARRGASAGGGEAMFRFRFQGERVRLVAIGRAIIGGVMVQDELAFCRAPPAYIERLDIR